MLTEPTSRILLIDDQQLFSDGIKRLLNDQPDLTVYGQIFQAKDTLPAIQRTDPHLVLLDINLQESSGIDLGKTILNSFPSVRILILTMYRHLKLVDEVRRAGLHGYLLKEVSTPDLLHGIRTVLAGNLHFDPALTNRVQPTTDPFGDSFAQRLNLTFREVEIIRLIKEGLSNEQIAERIHLSIETVKTHRKNIHFKLGISKVADLVRFAIENSL